MGRYYSGDINGKFWFGIQQSDDAEQFGARIDTEDDVPTENYIQYVAEDIVPCRKRCDELFNELGIEPRYDFAQEQDVQDFIMKHYVDEKLTQGLLASLELGLKIHRMLSVQDEVYFEAEI